MSAGPLVGMRVLDFGLAMSGPLAAQKLGDLGADVIKVEPPTGEWQRSRAAGDAWVNRMNASFLALNRNKRSIALDLKAPAGKDIALRLVETADVAIFNFRAGVSSRLGLDYDSLRAINERMVYCSITGYGESGPLAHRPGQDLVLQGYSGLMWNGGRRGDPPAAVPVMVVDATVAGVATQGILAALVARGRTGLGQKLEVSMLDAIVDLQIHELTVFLTTGVRPERTEEPIAHGYIPGPYGVFCTADGYMTVSFGPLDVLGDLLESDRLSSLASWSDAMRNRDEIYRIVAEALPRQTTAEWLEIFDRHGIWAGPVFDYARLAEEPQLHHNAMVVEVEHPTEGRLRLVGPPIKFSGTPASVRLPQPLLGQHSGEILHELGFDRDETAALLAQGIVAQERLDSPEAAAVTERVP